MLSFKAYFWNNDVYINEKYRFDSNEILTAYLNDKHYNHLYEKDFIYNLKYFKRHLQVSRNMDYQDYINYNDTVCESMRFTDELNKMLKKLPPYNKILGDQIARLDDILNNHNYFFENGIDLNEYYYDEDTVTEYGMGEKDEYGNYTMRLFKFQLQPTERIDMEDDDTRLSLHELNQAVSGFFDMYIKLVTAYMQVHEIYKPFLTKYFHQKEAFPTGSESAQYFEDFNRANTGNFRKIKCKMESFGYKVLKGEDDNLILCEEIGFNNLGSFLYYDFFNGIKQNYVPNRCRNCGKFFLIKGSWYYTYCDRKLRKEPSKTCRDVGSKRRYDDKCKNDPVWQTYNRAYKAHYARYMKKKMTVSEFEEWSRFASEIRDRALAGEIEFDKYYADIRK
ncbi:MAG: hypothetical protein HDT44_02760 [Ruminococcaceae bacterium]|nr:hypothetical protein [Oscillospiraceae bacterium]